MSSSTCSGGTTRPKEMIKLPTYEYHCSKCNTTLDVWQSIHEDAIATHSGCGGELIKVFAAPMFNAHQGQSDVQHDENGNTTTNHWDGSRDVTIRPQTTDIQVVPQQS